MGLGRECRLQVAGGEPRHQAQVKYFSKCLLCTQLCAMHRGDLKDPQKMAEVLQVKVDQNEDTVGSGLVAQMPRDFQGQRSDGAGP